MVTCCVRGCESCSKNKSESLSFFSFPTNDALKKVWLNNIGTENIKPVKFLRVCSKHIENDCINKTLQVVRLKDDVAPTLFPPKKTHTYLLKPANTESLQTVNMDIDPSTIYTKTSTMPSTSKYTGPGVNETTNTSFCDPRKTILFAKNILPKPVCTQALQTKTTDQYLSTTNKGNITTAGLKKRCLGTTDTTVLTEQELSTESTSLCENVTTIPAKKLQKLDQIITWQQKKIRSLSQKCLRLKKKIFNYQNIIDDLKNRNLVPYEGSLLLEECAGSPEFLKRQILKFRGDTCPQRYGEEIRKFALTLNFLSPKAYRYVRKTYRNCLPHPRTITKWYQHIDAEPGFTAKAFKALEVKAQCSNSPLLTTLVIDEMAIRKGLCWDSSKKKYYGRVSMSMEESDSSEQATECFVLLLTALNDSWKIPVGYFFVNSLSGEQKANLVKMCIEMTEATGIKVVALTCDGPAANFAMFKELGCDLQKNQIETEFSVGKQTVCAFIDPCHAIKLIRNTFGDLKIIVDNEGNIIDFNYIQLLLEIQEKEGLHIGTKLSKSHVEYGSQKMKVRLATQLFSNSVADALEFCETKLKLPQFQGCNATAKFIRIINDLFDCLNSRSMRPPGWKKAIFAKNYSKVIQMFAYTTMYIKQLKLETGQLVVESRRKTGFIGMLVNMASAIKLYKTTVVEKEILKYLPLYKISQDHLELFFSAIRSKGGINNNPNAVQFKAAYKKILINVEIKDHGIGNCVPLEQISILNISSNNPVKCINELSEKKILIEEDDSTLYDEYLDHLNTPHSEYRDQVLVYIAGFIARKLTKNLKCLDCVGLLHGSNQNYSQSLIEKKNRGGLTYPSSDLVKIVKSAEKIIKQNLLLKEKPEKYYVYIFKFLMEHFENDNLFNSANREHEGTHKLLLIKSAIFTYLDIRYNYHGKKHVEHVSKRSFLTKLVLFRHE